MSAMETALAERLAAVRERLEQAARTAGRKSEDIRLIAVSKLHPAQNIRDLFALGQKCFGENYVQEALSKQDELSDLTDQGIEWHFIGRLQTNKAKDVAGRFALIHTVDSAKLAETLARRLPDHIKVQPVLLQVNIGNEPQKAGIAEEALPALAEAVLEIPRIQVQGLMCLPPFFDDGEAARPYFAQLRQLAEGLRERVGLPLPELSMGMSGDCIQAVEEGATIVRIGTDIFGPRPIKM